MQDFNSYANNSKDNDVKNELNGDLVSLVTRLATKYNNATESELLRAIYAEAEKGRKNGTLKDEDLDRFAAMLVPMLDDKKRKKLNNVVAKLKLIR